MEELVIKIPKGYMNVAISTCNKLIADTNDSVNWDEIYFPLPKGKWNIENIDVQTNIIKLVKNKKDMKQTAMQALRSDLLETIPNDAHSFEVFAIQDCEYSHTGKQAFIGFKLENGNFHFIGVPYTEPKNK